MNVIDKEIQIKKLILKFSIQYYEIKEKNLNIFLKYCNTVSKLTNIYINKKLNNNNKNNNFIINYHLLFTQINDNQPYDFLNCGLDFNDNSLIHYFEDLINIYKYIHIYL